MEQHFLQLYCSTARLIGIPAVLRPTLVSQHRLCVVDRVVMGMSLTISTLYHLKGEYVFSKRTITECFSRKSSGNSHFFSLYPHLDIVSLHHLTYCQPKKHVSMFVGTSSSIMYAVLQIVQIDVSNPNPILYLHKEIQRRNSYLMYTQKLITWSPVAVGQSRF